MACALMFDQEMILDELEDPGAYDVIDLLSPPKKTADHSPILLCQGLESHNTGLFPEGGIAQLALKDVRTCTRRFFGIDASPVTPCRLTDIEHARKGNRIVVQPTEPETVAEACRLASCIYRRATTDLIAFASARNIDDAILLHRLLTRTEIGNILRESAPRAYIWM